MIYRAPTMCQALFKALDMELWTEQSPSLGGAYIPMGVEAAISEEINHNVRKK